jgi:hypothetical protein
MAEKLPPPPPADAISEGKTIGKKEAIAMLRSDVSGIKDLNEPSIVMIAQFVRLVEENKDRPLDETRVKLVRDLVEVVFKNRDIDFVHTLAEVNNLVIKNLADMNLPKKSEK